MYNPFKKVFEISHKQFITLRNSGVFETVDRRCRKPETLGKIYTEK